MTLDFILTFDDRDQLRIDGPFYLPLISSKETLIAHVMTLLPANERQSLIKISMCAYTDYKTFDFPDWYENENGKIWVDDLEKFRAANFIESTVSKEYIGQFNSVNN